MENVQMYLVALMPALGTLIGTIVVAVNIVRNFRGLRKDVINDAEIASLKRQTQALQLMVRSIANNQVNDRKETAQLNRAVERIEQTAQRLDLSMSRLETKLEVQNHDQEV